MEIFPLISCTRNTNLPINQKKKIYNISYSKELFHNFAIGGGISYYYGLMANPNWEEFSETSGDAFGLNLSALYRIPQLNLISPGDEVRIGAIFNNLTSSKIYFIDEAQKDPISQELRVGVSYSVKPEFYWNEFRVMRFILAVSGNWNLTEYEFDTWNPNLGMELTLLEVLSLRYGRENWENLLDGDMSTIQFPVKRYGFGIQVPLNKIFEVKQDVKVIFDMVFSKWEHEDQFGDNPYYENSIQDSFISLQIQYGM